MAGKYQIVTEIVTTDGSDVPAPTFTVVKHNPEQTIWKYQSEVPSLKIIIFLIKGFIDHKMLGRWEKHDMC